MAEALKTRVSKLERSHLQTQKAIRSLVAAQKKTDQAVNRTEQTVAKLGMTVAKLGMYTKNGLTSLVELQAESRTEMARWQAAARKREQRLDERIAKLVSAIGELIRRNGTDK